MLVFFLIFQATATAHCGFPQEVLKEIIPQTSINTNLARGLPVPFLHSHPEVTILVPTSVLLPLV